jgi:hypothetical protein
MTELSHFARNIIRRELISAAIQTAPRFAKTLPGTADPEQVEAARKYIEICATLTELRVSIPPAPDIFNLADSILNEHHFRDGR